MYCIHIGCLQDFKVKVPSEAGVRVADDDADDMQRRAQGVDGS
jgi:hypothetical protein